LRSITLSLKKHLVAKGVVSVSDTFTACTTNVPVKIQPEDLDQEGLIALVKSVDHFDPRRKVKFESYAISTIRGAMLEYLRREDWVPRSVRTKQKLLKNDGTIVTQIVESVRRPARDLDARNASFNDGTRLLTVRSFLSANAIRAEDSMDRIDWCSSNNLAT